MKTFFFVMGTGFIIAAISALNGAAFLIGIAAIITGFVGDDDDQTY